MTFDYDILGAVVTGCLFAPLVDLIAFAIHTVRTRSITVSGFALLYTTTWVFEYMLDRHIVNTPELTGPSLVVLALVMVLAPAFLAIGTRWSTTVGLWLVVFIRLVALVTLPVSLIWLFAGTGGADGGTSVVTVMLGMIGPLALLATFLLTPLVAALRPALEGD